MIERLHILHLQSGGGLYGGIAGYIAGLVSSDCFENIDFSVSVREEELSYLKSVQKYSDANLVSFDGTYGARNFFLVALRLARLYQTNKIDLIHSHALRMGFLCAFLSLFTSIRFIYTNHGLRFLQKLSFSSRIIFRLIERFVIWRSVYTVCVRPYDGKYISHAFPGFAVKVRTVVTRISASKHFSEKQSLGVPLKIVGVGSLIYVKRVDRFIDWVSALSDLGIATDAVWLGDGPLRLPLEKRALGKGINISWLGNVSSGQVLDVLERFDIFFLTSDFEVLSLAALEAMSCSMPIVTTGFAGVEDFVIDGVTGIVLPQDCTALVAATEIKKLLSDSRCFSYLCKSSRSLFERCFNEHSRLSAEYMDLYSSAIRERE